MLLFILNRNAAGCARVAHRAALAALPLVASLRRNDPRHGRALLRQHRRVGVEARPGIAGQRMGALLRRGVEDDGRKEVHRITGFVGQHDRIHIGRGQPVLREGNLLRPQRQHHRADAIRPGGSIGGGHPRVHLFGEQDSIHSQHRHPRRRRLVLA